MNKVPPFLQSLFAGGLAALATSALIWVCTVTGLFVTLGIPVAAPADAAPWFAWRIVWGCIFGLFFFVPLLTDLRETVRGLLVSLLPILKLFLWDYPQGGEGWFGLNLGILLTVTAVVTWLLWGLVAGFLLDWWDFGTFVEEEEPPPA
ncbi:MAG TPA: hypothetical protein VKB51_20085 [bacterium]|nr:hypothetical protein [bacterium]